MRCWMRNYYLVYLFIIHLVAFGKFLHLPRRSDRVARDALRSFDFDFDIRRNKTHNRPSDTNTGAHRNSTKRVETNIS